MIILQKLSSSYLAAEAEGGRFVNISISVTLININMIILDMNYVKLKKENTLKTNQILSEY